MVIPASLPGTNPIGTAAEPAPPAAPPATSSATASTITYVEFAAAVKDALRDVHSPDLLARNPLLRDGLWDFGGSAGPQELKTLLCETVHTLFGNARDGKLRRILELTYSEPFLKQEVVADRLALSFGTYRRHLSNARDRMARWLWETSRLAPIQSEPPQAADPTATGASGEDETAMAPAIGEPAPRLSIVVLPFLNIGGSVEDDPFVDGITETLTTDLSRCSGVFVISRNTAFAYKGKPIDTRQIGRELGVHYVLEGSVQNAGERIRFNAQLVDAESGGHLWAERFDKQRADLLDMQDEVTTRLARTIHIEMIAAESRRAAREHPDRLDALDHTLLGWAAWNRNLSLESARRARRFFKTALQLDENNVGALIGFANAHMWEVNMSYASDDRLAQIRAAETAAKQALTLAPDSAEARVTYGTVLYAMRAPERALREFEFAIGLDANLAAAHAYLGQMKFSLGRARETHAHVAEAMRLSPRDPLFFHWHFFIGVAEVYLGRVVHGIENLRESVEINPNWGLAQFVLAGALALAGLLSEAAEVRAAAQRLVPNFTIARFRAGAASDNPIYLAQREQMYRGLRLSGVPEDREG
jgi:TolB-like protein